MNSTGKARRLRKIFREDGKTVIVPMDHGVSLGPIKGIVNMQIIVDRLLEGGVDAIVVHRGIASHIDVGEAGLIVHLSASTKIGPSPLWKVRVCSVEEAIRLGADAISVHINVGAENEPEMLADLGEVADDCNLYGMPLLVMAYPRGPNIKSEHDPEHVAHAARLAAELGADVVKTNFTGSVETFKKVVQGSPVPVVIAGGPKAESVQAFLKMVSDAMEAGAKGVSIGRNVFQADNPTAMVKALNAIVHEHIPVEAAIQILKA
jgi:fructose-bisphosphate aldolase/2-amino-3,7-dideoxy-D-threo-hept-6-ulosonate synthase